MEKNHVGRRLFIRKQIGIWTESPVTPLSYPAGAQHCAIRKH